MSNVFVVLRDELDGCWMDAAFTDLESALAFADVLDAFDVRIERCNPKPEATWHRRHATRSSTVTYMHYEGGRYIGDVVRNRGA